MTDSDVFFDSDPWFDVLRDSDRGRRLVKKYGSKTRVHTSVLTLAEIGAKLLEERQPLPVIEKALRTVEQDSHAIHPVTTEDALLAWRRRAELRKVKPDAGLGDALILCQSERLGFPLVSADGAFEGRKNVRAETGE